MVFGLITVAANRLPIVVGSLAVIFPRHNVVTL